MILFAFFQQIRYPINQQRIQRGANNRYRVSGPSTMLTNRFVNTKQKKTKAKREKKISKSEETDELNDEKKINPKEEVEEEPTIKSENGYVNWIKKHTMKVKNYYNCV